MRLDKYTGTKGLAEIFKKAGKVYIKGNKCQNLVEALDVGMILDKVAGSIAPLYEAIDFDMSA